MTQREEDVVELVAKKGAVSKVYKAKSKAVLEQLACVKEDAIKEVEEALEKNG